MATYTLWYRGADSTASGKGEDTAFPFRPTYIDEEIIANIPRFSAITKAVVALEAKRDGSSLNIYNTNFKWVIRDSSNQNIASFDEQTNVVTTSFKAFSKNYIDYICSKTADAGKINSKLCDHFAGYVDGSISRTNTAQKRRIEYTFEKPKVTINTSKNIDGGLITATITHEVEIADYSTTLTASPNTGYKFVKWIIDGVEYLTPNVSVLISQNSISAYETTKNAVAYFEKITYTATFKNYDGTVLQSVAVEHGSTPVYTGATPTKVQDAQYFYDFSGWSPSLGAITANTTYTAQYTATKRSYIITAVASPSEAGAVTGGGSGLYGTTKTLTAKANSGYKFVKWSDGITTASRTVSVTGNATYTAVFGPIYVAFDSIFNFEKWKANGITGSNSVVSDITDTGFTLTSNSEVNEGTASSPYFPVEAGKSYKIDIDTIGDGWDVYIFFHSETSTGTGLEFTDATNRFSSNGSGNATRVFTAPEGAVKAQIRCDANGSSNTVTFSNFRIYPADCEYMSTTVAAEDRSNAISWDIPTPTCEGYEFIGWNTEPDGSGTAYTSDSSFPADDLTLYSQWKVIALPEFSSVQITPNPCDAGQGFIISVAFIE